MVRRLAILILALVALFPALGSSAELAEEEARGSPADIRVMYERLEPGMRLAEVAAIAKRPGLTTTREPVTSWLLWSPPAPGYPTAVLRAFFRDDRVTRLEYESFGERYERLGKGHDPVVQMSEAEARHLGRRAQAGEQCERALEAFHQLVLRLQERLTTAEQEAWVQALKLRKAVAAELTRPAR